jgi:hypothetical protein
MQSIAKRRRTFEKELLAALGPALKGTGWKKSGCVLFRESEGLFQEIDISVFLNDEKIRVTQRIKPMTLDPILWDILGLSENASEPLSFRSMGAFTCLGLPIYEELLDETFGGVTDAVVALSTIAHDNEQLFERVLAGTDFSTLLAQHPNHRECGAYAVTLVTSLINDGDRDAAAHLASAYESGDFSSCMNLSSNGISFHRLALDWIASGTLLERFTL